MTERVVLAYSGGLDTSVAIGWIAEETGAEVIAVAVDVGQGGEDLDVIRERALACGAVEAVVVDARDEFADEYCLPGAARPTRSTWTATRWSPRCRGRSSSSTSSRPRASTARRVAHGCTGKGNDQVRFEVGIGALAPDLHVLAPVRDSGMTRDKAIAFAEENGLPIDVTKKSPYSIDQNLWGRAVETGFLEDIWNAPDRGRLRLHRRPGGAARRRRGRHHLRPRRAGRDRRPAGHRRSRPSVELNERAGAQGVGRLDLVEDRLVGIKSREVYEAPGAIALITAHQELENVTVERDLARFKRPVDQRWGELVYDGLWFSPLKRALDSFLDEANEHVSGDIRMTLHGGRAVVTGRRSDAVALRLRAGDLRLRATCSTSRWPRASSSSGACRPRWPPGARPAVGGQCPA